MSQDRTAAIRQRIVKARKQGDHARVAELEAERLADRIRTLVDNAPPLTADQRRRLALLLGSDDTESPKTGAA